MCRRIWVPLRPVQLRREVVTAHLAAHVAHVGGVAVEYFHDHQRIEQLLFDGSPRPVDGVLAPDPHRWGHGMTLRTGDAEPYRVA
jgi:hypothetical protein